MTINEKYSYKDFTGQSLKHIDAEELNNAEIVGSCFFMVDEPYSDIFPVGMVGVTFRKCCLDTIFVPPGNTIIDSPNRQFECQNDLEYWFVDKEKKPTAPKDIVRHTELKLSSDPKDIPTEYIREETVLKCRWDQTFGLEEIAEKSLYKEIPNITDSQTKEKTSTITLAKWNDMISDNDFSPFDTKPSVISQNIKEIILQGYMTTYTISSPAYISRAKKQKALFTEVAL